MEAALASSRVARRGTRGLGTKCAAHAFMPAVLMRLAGLGKYEADSWPNPLADHPGAAGDLANRPAENW
jgi:hypothetical protein